ncbi:MAG TPA: adenylyltransferase/cytidyltransferase family protein [Acetobacteraceae bacterium]
MTSGVFDLVHRGHLETLAQARALGHRLIVATNTDESVRRKKGPLRQINPLADRMFVLASLRAVDAVIAFDEENEHPVALVQAIRPNVFVKSSGEWNDANCFFKEPLESLGGRAERLAHVPGYSSSALIARIVERYPRSI